MDREQEKAVAAIGKLLVLVKKAMAAIGKFLLLVILGIVVIVLNGWALAIMWGWFVTPLGFPIIHTIQAIGIITVASLFRHSTKQEKEPDWFQIFGTAVFSPLFILGFGWIVHLFL